MNPFDMVSLIVLVVAVASVLKAWLNRGGRAGPDAATQARIAKLEERVKSLEAVVTDHGYDLKRQFQELEKH